MYKILIIDDEESILKVLSISLKSDNYSVITALDGEKGIDLFNNENPQIINSVTGDAYQYGDDVPRSWNDPRYPDLEYPISNPFPLNPARYKAPRNIRFGFSFEF